MTLTALTASAQVNSWINPASGSWDDSSSWSLGVLPDSSQSVMITNAGWKAVSIQPSAASDFPQTLAVNSVTIASPTNSANTLLLNFIGAGNPLVIGVDTNNPGSLAIDSNSAMAMFSSGLIVNNALGATNSRLGEFEVDGSFAQSDGSEVVAGFLDLTGKYGLTNGMLFVVNEFINGTFNQQGGTNVGALDLESANGDYELFDGSVQGTVILRAGTFNQSGGTNTAGLITGYRGTYNLTRGLLQPGDLVIGSPPQNFLQFAGGGIEQTGGALDAGNVSMVFGFYDLRGGTLSAQSLTLTTNTLLGGLYAGHMTQYGGYQTNGGMTMIGGLDSRTNAVTAGYTLDGGLLETPSLTMTLSGFNQQLGTNRIGTMSMNETSTYLLNGGSLGAGEFLVASNSAVYQYGGAAVITNLQFGHGTRGAGGAYYLYGGDLGLPDGLGITGDNNSFSSYFQAGGTNQTTTVYLEAGLFGNSPTFTLNGGLLADDTVDMIADEFGGITITQNGGTHVTTNVLNVIGGAFNPDEIHPAIYQLNGGTLFAGFMNMDATEGSASFNQTDGTARMDEIQAHASGGFTYFITEVNLSGGTLIASNFSVTDGGAITQTGGALGVSNSLSFGGYIAPGPNIFSRYQLLGGTLTAANINVGGDWIIGDSTTNRISNPGACTLSHTITISNAVEQLGRFILASNAIINLAGSTSRLGFANSSGEIWSGSATLVVSNWNGNPSGGGAEQLRFGTDQFGLTSAELSQIQFRVGPYLYSAKILNTGEVVPDQLIAPLAIAKHGNNLVLTWQPGWSLQSATNAPGPYSDVPGATSPYTNDITLAQQFFRLRQ